MLVADGLFLEQAIGEMQGLVKRIRILMNGGPSGGIIRIMEVLGLYILGMSCEFFSYKNGVFIWKDIEAWTC